MVYTRTSRNEDSMIKLKSEVIQNDKECNDRYKVVYKDIDQYIEQNDIKIKCIR